MSAYLVRIIVPVNSIWSTLLLYVVYLGGELFNLHPLVADNVPDIGDSWEPQAVVQVH